MLQQVRRSKYELEWADVLDGLGHMLDLQKNTCFGYWRKNACVNTYKQELGS